LELLERLELTTLPSAGKYLPIASAYRLVSSTYIENIRHAHVLAL